MSRLKESAKCDLLTKMKIYNGDDIIEKGRVKRIDIKDLREETSREGMSGISTRFITKALDTALTDSECNMITPVSAIEALTKSVKDQIVDEEFKEYCLSIIQNVVREEYLSILEKEIAKAFAEFELSQEVHDREDFYDFLGMRHASLGNNWY